MHPTFQARHADGCLLIERQNDYLEYGMYQEYELDASQGPPYYHVDTVEHYGDPIDVCIAVEGTDDPYTGGHCVEDQAEHSWTRQEHGDDRNVYVVCYIDDGCAYELTVTGFDTADAA